MNTRIQSWAAMAKGQPLMPYTFEFGPLGADEVEVAVEHWHHPMQMVNLPAYQTTLTQPAGSLAH